MPLPAPPDVRLDKWLWAARVFKTRSEAMDACRAGHVKRDGSPLKPAAPVRLGEILEVQTDGWLRRFEVKALIHNRVGPVKVPEVLHDFVPRPTAEERRGREVPGWTDRPWTTGRPSGKDRRLLDQFLSDARQADPS